MIFEPSEINKIKLDGVVGLTSGCFDLIHRYHKIYFERCKAHCDFLIVGVDADELIQKFKNKTPIQFDSVRAEMVAALKYVDAVFILRNLNDFAEIARFSNKIFKNAPELYGQPIIGTEHAELVIIPDVQEFSSTTQTLEHIRKGS